MHYEDVLCFDAGDKVEVLGGYHKGKIATVKYQTSMSVWCEIDGEVLPFFEENLEPIEGY